MLRTNLLLSWAYRPCLKWILCCDSKGVRLPLQELPQLRAEASSHLGHINNVSNKDSGFKACTNPENTSPSNYTNVVRM